MRWICGIAVGLSLLVQPVVAQSWKQAVRAEIAAVERAVAPYRDIRKARADGWRRSTGHVPLMGEHWAQRRGVDYVAGDYLDLSRPSNLIYAEVGGRMELIAVAYVVRIDRDDPLPSGFTGPADVWHVHNLDQILRALGERRPLLSRMASRWIGRKYAADGNRRMAMVHVWLYGNNPAGVFANLNPTLSYRRAGLSADYSKGASLEAAQGIALLHKDGCNNELDAKLWLAAPSGRTKRQLRKVCEAAQEKVQSAVRGTPAELNRAAAEAWRDFDSTRYLLLTDAERRRLASIVEGAGGSCTVAQ